MRLIYGTTNPAKLKAMRDNLTDSGIEIMGPGVDANADETGSDPMQNARIKARAFYALLKQPVFALDSGLYIDGLSDAEQPGTHVRRVNGIRLTDEGMIEYYTSIARRMGGYACAHYRNAVCLIMDEEHIYEHDGDDISSVPFYLAALPHAKRNYGFPLDSISVEISSGKYYYDINSQNKLTAKENGYRDFFLNSISAYARHM